MKCVVVGRHAESENGERDEQGNNPNTRCSRFLFRLHFYLTRLSCAQKYPPSLMVKVGTDDSFFPLNTASSTSPQAHHKSHQENYQEDVKQKLRDSRRGDCDATEAKNSRNNRHDQEN